MMVPGRLGNDTFGAYQKIACLTDYSDCMGKEEGRASAQADPPLPSDGTGDYSRVNPYAPVPWQEMPVPESL